MKCFMKCLFRVLIASRKQGPGPAPQAFLETKVDIPKPVLIRAHTERFRRISKYSYFRQNAKVHLTHTTSVTFKASTSFIGN